MARLVLPGVAADPNVMPARPGVDYVAVASTAWLSAVAFAGDMAGDDLVLADLAEQERACTAWFASHGKDDPQWGRAWEREIEIENTETAVRITRWFHARGCWTSCCDCYAALSHLLPLERQSWLLDHAPDMVTDHPAHIWARLRPEEDAPGSWPPQDEEAHITRRMGQAPVWQRETTESGTNT